MTDSVWNLLKVTFPWSDELIMSVFSRRHAPALVLALALAVSLLSAWSPAPSAQAAVPALAASGAETPSASNPYSDPVWFPLRNPSRVDCVRTNCNNGTYHNYEALDLKGAHGDPIYAMGAGIAHIGGTATGCTLNASEVDQGTWVWVDHGAYGITKYLHLSSIAIREGQLVTPATQLGTMGNTGGSCRVAYTHLEWQAGERYVRRFVPPALRSCVGGQTISLPSGLKTPTRYTRWNDVPSIKYFTRAATNSCIPTSWNRTPAAPSISGRPGDRSTTVSWSARPAGTDSVRVQREQYHPSLGSWLQWAVRTGGPTAGRTTFSGLENNKQYRYRVAFHNASGWSAWSRWVTVVPMAKPPAPRAPRSLTSTTGSVLYSWYRTPNTGSPVTAHYVARRTYYNGRWSSWTQYKRSPDPIYVVFRNLARNRTYQVTVRATNALGTSPWAKISTIRTTR